MFGKFKKFAMMFVFCMSIFGVTAFAYTDPEGVEYSYRLSFSNGSFKAYSNSPFERVDDNGYISYYATGKTYIYSENVRYQTVESGGLIGKGWNDFVEESDVEIIPPEIAPTVMEAIQKIVPDLSSQLKILLPVGVILLSTMLGVSLVRRLVPLFL